MQVLKLLLNLSESSNADLSAEWKMALAYIYITSARQGRPSSMAPQQQLKKKLDFSWSTLIS